MGRFPWGYVLIAFGLGILASSIFLYVTASQLPATAAKQTTGHQRSLRAN